MAIKVITGLLISVMVLACGKPGNKFTSIEMVTEAGKQDAIFRDLMTVSKNIVPVHQLNDSLAFLVLPVQASCPACRKKTIDSIIKYQDRLMADHFIIISAKGGHKAISGYFREEHADLPSIEGRLFLDSTNEASKYDLYDEKPTMYYAHHQKVYKKVAAIPATVKQDLQEFFSGYRNESKK